MTLILIPLVFLADQWTKCLVLAHFRDGGGPLEVLPFFNIILTYNRGISFSLFHTDSAVGFWILTAIIAGFLLFLCRWYLQEKARLPKTCLGLIIGAALGNLYDRVTLGGVVDFLDLHWGTAHFATFNLADSFISVSAILLSLYVFTKKEKK